MAAGKAPSLPGEGLRTDRMPGHWLLARLGKRVLRPGGRMLTEAMIASLAVNSADRVVEFAPGLGTTARVILANGLVQYVGIERDADAARWARANLPDGAHIEVRHADADDTGLADGSASVVLGEAILSITTARQKQAMVGEAFRLLSARGRYGIHELALVPDDLDAPKRAEIASDLSQAIHVGARPLGETEWCALLRDAGFEIEAVHRAPMRLLEPARLVSDEGVLGTLRILRNLLRDVEARVRVIEMFKVFRRHRRHMGAVAIVAVKP